MTARVEAEARAWQRMLSGRRLDLLNPSPLDIEIEDIAHGLARVARWNGQTHGNHPYSVAQHSLLVEQIFGMIAGCASSERRLMALLHDAPEYVIGDMISPFKAVMGGAYKGVEARLQEAIHLRYALPPAMPQKLKARIKRADRIAAFHEATRLAGFCEAEAVRFFGRPRNISPDVLDLRPGTTQAVEEAFLNRFATLEAQRVEEAKSKIR